MTNFISNQWKEFAQQHPYKHLEQIKGGGGVFIMTNMMRIWWSPSKVVDFLDLSLWGPFPQPTLKCYQVPMNTCIINTYACKVREITIQAKWIMFIRVWAINKGGKNPTFNLYIGRIYTLGYDPPQASNGNWEMIF